LNCINYTTKINRCF